MLNKLKQAKDIIIYPNEISFVKRLGGSLTFHIDKKYSLPNSNQCVFEFVDYSLCIDYNSKTISILKGSSDDKANMTESQWKEYYAVWNYEEIKFLQNTAVICNLSLKE